MITQDQIQTLGSIKHQLETMDKEKIYRTYLGEASLEQLLKPRIENMINNIEFALDNSKSVHEQTFQFLIDIFTTVLGEISNISSIDASTYVGEGKNYIANIDSQFEELKLHWVHFIAAAIEQKGLLDDEDIKIQHQRAIKDLGQEADKHLERVKEESAKILTETSEAAQQIENKARLTAAGISVEVAQDQFGEAQKEFKNQAILWAILSTILIAAFIGVAFYFVNNSQPNEKLGFGVIYFTTLRITILAAIGGVAAFCLRIFRANMHMRAHNLHRQRLANSMAAFVESASTNEQRDLILAHLVDAIASFGSSGLLTKSDDSMNPSKMTIDTITRTLTGSSQ